MVNDYSTADCFYLLGEKNVSEAGYNYTYMSRRELFLKDYRGCFVFIFYRILYNIDRQKAHPHRHFCWNISVLIIDGTAEALAVVVVVL